MKTLSCLLLICSSLFANFTWTPDVQISDPSVQGEAPNIVLDPNGNAVAVWGIYNYSLGQLVVQAATKLYGQPWSAPETISNPVELSAEPLVVVDPNGNALAVWGSNNGILHSSTKFFGQPWSPQDSVPLGGSGAEGFDLVMDMNGLATLIWYEQTFMVGFKVYASEKPLGGSWDAVATLLSGSGGAIYPAVGIDAAGNVTGTWEDSQNIVAALKPFGMGWQPTTTIIGTGTSFAPQISVNPQGDAIVIASGYTGVSTAYKPFGGPWQPYETIPGSSTDPDSRPVVGIDHNSNSIAFWSGMVSTTKFGGQPWGPISTFASGYGPVISTDGCNLTLIAWSGAGVEVSSGIIGGSFSTPFAITGGNASSLAVSPCGHAMVGVLGGGGQINGQPSTAAHAIEGFEFSGASSFSGFQKKNDFGTLSEYENHLQWVLPTQGNINSFSIYRNGTFLTSVKGNKREYIDPDQLKGVPVEYGIAAVDANGAETSQITTIVP